MAGTTISKVSSPVARTAGPSNLDVVEHFNERLVEAEVACGAGDPSIFNKEEAVAGHAGHDLFVRVHFADVPEAGHEESRSVEATIFSSEESPPPKTKFMGASPYSFGRAKPWPVGFLPAALALARE